MLLLTVLAASFSVLATAKPSQTRTQVQNYANLTVTRSGTELRLSGKRWTASGANVYWLGLDENVIPPAGEPFYAPLNASYPTKGRVTEVMRVLNAMGATAIRSHTLGVSTGNPLSLEPELGVFNGDAFDAIDWAVYEAGRHNLKLMIPLTDNWDYYHGGKFNFLRWRGFNISGSDSKRLDSAGNPIVQQFYTNSTIIQDFKDYIRFLITHRNRYNNLTYAEDPTIFAYETGNELSGPSTHDMWVPSSWVQDIGSFIKSIAPAKLFVDGTYGVNQSHFGIKEIDIFSNHYYPLNVTKLNADIALVESTGRVYQVGEYDWHGVRGDNITAFLGVIETQQAKARPVVSGEMFWSLFGHNVPDCSKFVGHSDGLALQYGNPANSKLQNTQIDAIQMHLWHLRGEHHMNITGSTVVACPTGNRTLDRLFRL